LQASTITWNAWGDSRLALAIALLGAILAASLLYTPIPLVVLLAFPAFFYFISRPYELLLLMVFLIPFNFVFRIGPIPLAAELLKVFAWIPFLVYLSARKQPFKTSKYNWCFAVLGGLLLLSLFRSNDLPFTIKESVRFVSNIGLCYLVLNLVDSRKKVFQIFQILVFSTFLVACYGFYQFAIQNYGALFWIVNARLDTSLAPGRDTFWLWRDRITSVLTSELELGHYFNLCLPIGLVLWLTEGRKCLRSRWLWMTVAMLAGLVLTFTFGAWLALVTTTAFFILLSEKEQRWKMVLAGTLMLALVAAVLALGPLHPFLEQKIGGTGMGSLAWDVIFRLDAWLFALNIWWSHPLLGVGIGSFQILQFEHDFIHSDWAPTGSSPHQTYLYVLVQLGVVGFVSVLTVMLGSIKNNLILRTNRELGLIGLALAFALATNMFGWFSDDAAFFGPHASYLVWLFIGISEAMRNLAVPTRIITA
jgi:O-antigen ligase